MAPSNVILYAACRESDLANVYVAIASDIVLGRRDLAVGVVAVGDTSAYLVQKIERPTVQWLNEVRENARQTFDRTGSGTLLTLADFVDKATQFANQQPEYVSATEARLVIATDEEVRGDTTNSIQYLSTATSAPRPELPPKQVATFVKTFDGSFTVGDPASPLIEVSVSCYPATRRAAPIATSYFGKNGRHVVSTSVMQTSAGPVSRPEDVQKGYNYLSEVVTADAEVQKMMDGEFEGAESWPKAFELLATVPEVPPWLPLDHSDYVVGKNYAASQFIGALSSALKHTRMHALARRCKAPKSGHHKGTLELVLLQPWTEDLLLATPLPFKEDFKAFYRFAEIPGRPLTDSEAELDNQMDELVSGMITDAPEPVRNPQIVRVATFVRDLLANNGNAEVPPLKDLPVETKRSERLDHLSQHLSREFGIVEKQPVAPARLDASQDQHNYQATQTEVDLDELLK